MDDRKYSMDSFNLFVASFKSYPESLKTSLAKASTSLISLSFRKSATPLITMSFGGSCDSYDIFPFSCNKEKMKGKNDVFSFYPA